VVKEDTSDNIPVAKVVKSFNLNDLDDGAILVWSAKEKKWIVSLE
jgi:hypothetical protein